MALGTRPLGLLEPFVSPPAMHELDAARDEAAELLAGRVVWHVSSTARGGGVAEMLRTLTPYWRGAGVDARWLVLEARRDFFTFTKRLHALLHGQDVAPPGPDDRRLYEEVSMKAAGEALAAVAPGDVVVLHDPQTAGLTAPIAQGGAVVIWRCHVGADVPSEAVRSAWRFLLPYVAPADAYVFTRDTFIVRAGWPQTKLDRAGCLSLSTRCRCRPGVVMSCTRARCGIRTRSLLGCWRAAV